VPIAKVATSVPDLSEPYVFRPQAKIERKTLIRAVLPDFFLTF
jgi:hypothetical protein